MSKKTGRLVTVFCDASFDDFGRCAFAVWAKTSGLPTKRWAQNFKTQPENSSEAEFFAAANAVYLVVKHFELQKGDTILLQTDCMEVVTCVKRLAISLSKKKRECVNSIHKAPCYVHMRHVKGHMRKSETEPRHAVNQWCDLAANKLRKAQAKCPAPVELPSVAVVKP